MKKLVLVIMGVVMLSPVIGKDNPIDSTSQRSRISYWFTVELGGTIGCEMCDETGNNVRFSAATIQGIRFGDRLRLGVGIGYDNYENWKAAPLFGSASWDVAGKKNRLYVQLNYGYSFATLNDDARVFGYVDSSGGTMINPVVGYRLAFNHLRLSLAAGYKFQRLQSTYDNNQVWFDRGFWPWPSTSTTVQTDMNRLVVKLGIGLN